MNKILVFFLFCFSACTILCMIMEGGGGIATTVITGIVDADDTTINVTSTAHFLDTDFVWIGDERIPYTGKTDTSFTGCVRGTEGTIAVYHGVGTKVYNESSNILYKALGFNVGESNSILGTFGTLVKVVIALVKVIPRTIAWNYSFLAGDLSLVKYILLYPLSAGLVFTLVAYIRQLIWK